ncbi:MAG: FMN-binding negative transcriptional regulator [Bryobacteraceae bacterium]
MYNPGSFVEDRIDVLHAFIRHHPFATIVTCGANGPEASHVPVVLHTDIGPKGVLRCHLARANDQWESVQSSSSVLAIFQGSHHYISPSWYPSKQELGKVVPTWNYVAVHVRGPAKLFENRDELLEHLNTLTNQNERAFEKPWSVADAPKDYVEAMSKSIIGVEIIIGSIEGKRKLGQNRSEADRRGVVSGLTALDSPSSLEMANLVSQGELK